MKYLLILALLSGCTTYRGMPEDQLYRIIPNDMKVTAR